MIFKKIQFRIADDTNKAIKIYNKRNKIIPNNLNSSKYIHSWRTKKIKRFYKKKLIPFIEKSEFDVNSFIVNILPRLIKIVKNKNNKYNNSADYLDSFLKYISHSINKLHMSHLAIKNSKDTNELVELINHENDLIDKIYTDILEKNEQLLKHHIKSDKKRFLKIKIKKKLNIIGNILSSLLICSTAFYLLATDLGYSNFDVRNLNPRRTTISIPKTTINGNIKFEEIKVSDLEKNIAISDNVIFQNVNNLHASQRCIDLIKEFEGFRSNAYLCPANVWTVGYGHTRTARSGMRISRSEAERLLRQDLEYFEIQLRKLIEVKLTQNQYDALLSFIFNIGETQFRNSTLLRILNSGNYESAIKEFNRWVYANGKVLAGLERRRNQEASLFARIKG